MLIIFHGHVFLAMFILIASLFPDKWKLMWHYNVNIRVINHRVTDMGIIAHVLSMHLVGGANDINLKG